MGNFREILLKLKRPIIIGIAGDSGSGKTTYSNGIRRLLGIDLVQTITMDGYHSQNRQERKISGKLPLDPECNHFDLFLKHLEALKKGETINLPIYNHTSGDFDNPTVFTPGPIIIIEGLHTLYPEFADLYDFKIYVDPSREVKREWKYQRDINVRHHDSAELNREMLAREAAYKRWIDFQKTNANAVVKITHSKIRDFARYEMIRKLGKLFYKVELIMEATSEKMEEEVMHFDLPSLFTGRETPFLLACVPSLYWGKQVSVVHIDGAFSEKTIKGLERYIFEMTGIPVDDMLQNMPSTKEFEKLTGVQLAQLLIGWRFLEMIRGKIGEDH